MRTEDVPQGKEKGSYLETWQDLRKRWAGYKPPKMEPGWGDADASMKPEYVPLRAKISAEEMSSRRQIIDSLGEYNRPSPQKINAGMDNIRRKFQERMRKEYSAGFKFGEGLSK